MRWSESRAFQDQLGDAVELCGFTGGSISYLTDCLGFVDGYEYMAAEATDITERLQAIIDGGKA